MNVPKILTVIGARPQIIKAAALSRAVSAEAWPRIEEKILHTGQHYDSSMSQIFFDQLGIPKPDYNLGVGSGSHAVQTAKMLEGIEGVLASERFDGVVLYGDTNSTLAGAVAASKLNVPVFHIEAGLRSYNMSMPEELNRIVCDHLSSILFAPTQTAVNNIMAEGLGSQEAVFQGGKKRKVVNSGDVMFDNSLYFAEMASRQSTILQDLGIAPGGFILATVHRPGNTDDPGRLTAILSTLCDIAGRDGLPLVLPLHPRTAKILGSGSLAPLLRRLESSRTVKLIPPASFFDIMMLEKNARIVMTDSGGVQKEAFFFGRPCVILRSETEWVEIVRHGAGILADADPGRILAAYDSLLCKKTEFPGLFGDGHAAKTILDEMVSYIS